MLRKLTNLAAFQLCWFACVLGAASGHPALGVAMVTGWALVHLLTNRATVETEAGLMACAAMLGLAGDSALVLAGLIEFPAPARLGAPTTLWMVALWIAFATTLGHSLGWLRGRYALGAAAGAVFGPLAYWAGSRLGAVSMPGGAQSLIAVCALWLTATPALLVAQAHLERRGAAAPEAC